MPKRIQHYVIAKNIIPNSIISDSDPVLSLSRLNPAELLDIVSSSRVVGIIPQDGDRFPDSRQQVWVSLG